MSDKPQYQKYRWHSVQGSNNPNAKLTEEDAAHIKWYLKEGHKPCHLAIMFGVTDSVISNIKQRYTWATVKAEAPEDEG